MVRLGEKFSQHAKVLGSASPELALTNQQPTYTEIPLSQIETDPSQPRRNLGDLSELAASIRELGVVQPIIVTIIGQERYRILAGERRFSASRQAGHQRIPAIVRSVDEHERLELQLVENLHRKDLSPFEEAYSYQRLLDEFGLTHEELGRKLGKTQVSITETLRLLALPEAIQRQAQEEKGTPAMERISKSLLIEISRRPESEQFRLWEEARRGELTVKQVRVARTGGIRIRKPRAFTWRYPIALNLSNATVTVEFADRNARLENIVEALEEALHIERERIASQENTVR